jgi:hypothetical protein
MRSSNPVILFILFLFLSTVGYSQFKNEDELKKQAAKYFEDEDYANGFKLYSQLVSTYPKDPVYNFRLGVCMLYNDADKKKAIPYLNTASKTAKDNEKESLFYLGKAYHFNYQFDEAIKFYAAYKNIASASMIKKLQVDREIQACKNGKRLLSNLTELVVLEKKQLSENDYFRSYNLKDIGGKLLVKPDEFRSAADKKKKDKSIVYLPKSNDQLYFAGYGEKGENKDIYIVRKLPSGEWSKPENLGTPVNTEFDEDYPFLHPNGRVLYFASKGHNSMGGYDLFKSELDPSTSRWKEPVNLEFPINSPNDDILFVTDSLEKIAYFATTRQSPLGKIDVLKILTERRPAEFAFISGTVLKKEAAQSVSSKIKIKNIETGEDVGSFRAGADGNYSLKLPNGGKFIFTVETPGFSTQSEGVTVPTAYNYKPYKQAIGYDAQKLYITNFFDSKSDDENNYKEYLELIEQKSRMNVNADDFGINPENPLAGGNQPLANNSNQSKTNAEQAASGSNGNQTPGNDNQSSGNVKSNKNVSNKELIQMAYDDAKELQENADSLKKDASAAFAAANSKQDQANQKKQEAEQTQNKAAAETDVNKKQQLTADAEQQKDDAALYSAQSSTANNLAKQLEIDAINKQKEADLNLQYAKALEEAEKTKNNKQAIAKLEDLQKQLEVASKQKSNSNTLLENIKADANNKQQELQNTEEKQTQLDKDVNDITNELSNIDKQIAETKDKDLVENLKSQKQEQESDLADKKKEQEVTKNKIASLKEEAETLKSQADFASNIVGGNAEQLATNSTGQEAGSNQKSTENNQQSTAENNNAATAGNKQTPENKTQSNEVSNNIQPANNTDVNKASNNQTQNNGTVTNNQSANNTTGETSGNSNKTGSGENTESNSLPNNAVGNESGNNNQTQSIAAKGPASDLINQAQNNFNDEKKLFGAVTYTDAKAIQLKQQADEKFNNVLSDAKNVEAELQQINNTAGVSSAQSNNSSNNQAQIDEISTQADNLSKQASELRKNAKTLTGTDKQNAMNKISELEKQAADLHYKAAKQQLDSDKNTFASNEQIIQNLINKPENKANASQVQQLAEEADILGKAAQQLKEEAEADASVASRVGGLSNADEKQKTALAKQQQALKLLKGNTPEIANSIDTGTDVTQKLDELKNKLEAEKQTSNVALKTLSDANKAEYTASLARLNTAEKTNKTTPEVKDLKTQAQKNIQEASVELGKASINKNEDTKRTQLVDANQKMEEALKQIKQAEQILTGVPVANEQITTNGGQSTANENQTSENSTTDANTVTTNSISVNAGQPAIGNEQTTSVNGEQNRNENSSGGNGSQNNNPVNTNAEPVNTNSVATATNEVRNNGQNNQSAENSSQVSGNANQASENTNQPAGNNNKANDNNSQASNTGNQITNNTTGETPGTTKTQPGENPGSNSSNNNLTDNKSVTDNQTQTGTDALTSNTVSPGNSNQTPGSLSPQQINEIKNTPQFKEYTTLQKETAKYNDQASKEEYQAQLFKNKAAENINRAEQLRTDAAALPEGAEKQDKLQQADKLEQKGIALKTKADSLQELASNTRSFAESKKQEAEAYTQTLDKKTLANFAVAANASGNTNTNGTNENNPASNEKYASYSEPFKTNATKYDEQLGSLQTSNTNPENLKEQNAVITNYLKTIDTELAEKKQQQAKATSPGEKNKVDKEIKTLQSKRTELKNMLTANQKTIKETNAAVNNITKNGGANVNNTQSANTNTESGNNRVAVNEGSTEAQKYIGTKGFEIKPGNAYNEKHPIPLNEKLPDGLVFRVQIGAFKNPISLDAFKGLTPVGGETTPQGFIRYQAGMFDQYNNANAVKNDLKKLGYTDAFVVAYLNGKRVNLEMALDTLKQHGQSVNTDANTTAGITANNNIPVNTQVNNAVAENTQPVQSSNLVTINGLLFTIQIGVYTNNVSNTQLGNLKPIYREQLTNGNYRYTAGIYSNLDLIKTDRAKVNAIGIADGKAFVSAYLNGQRIKVTDAIEKVTNDKTIQFPPQQPIIFPGGAVAPVNTDQSATGSEQAAVNNNASNTVTPAATGIQPFSNGVTQGPAPTAENGVKANDEGITFKVQIGAYRKQVPQQISDTWLKVKTWPINNIQVNDLYLYTIGSFTEARFAQKLRDEAVALGITDAFITVFKDGKKLYGAEAQKYLTR